MTYPKNWGIVALNALVDVLDNQRVPVNSSERSKRLGPVPYYGATGQVGTIDKAIFNEELLILGEDGVQFFDPNKPKAYKISGPSWVNNHAHVLRAKKDKVLQNYLMHFLNQFNYVGYANGTTRLKLTQGAMNSIPVPLPSIEEQNKIVELLEDHLSRLDAALADVKQAKLKAAQFRRSLLQAAFTGKLDAHDSEIKTELVEDWREERFGDIFKVKYGKAIDKSLRMEFAEYPVVGSAGVMTYTKIPLTTEPTIVIGRKGNVGSIQIFKEGCYPIDTTYYMPTISDFDIDFLTLQLTSLELVKLDSSTATPSLRREDLENVQLVVPPIEEQLKIVELLQEHLSRLDASVSLADAMERQSNGLRRSLLQAAFTGQLTKEVVSV